MKPTPKVVWLRIGTRLLKQLGLPCEIQFGGKNTKVFGIHALPSFPYTSMCSIVVSESHQFKYPEDLILHEAAHHANTCLCWEQHCECWAKVLLQMYEQTGTPLPAGSDKAAFAKIAGITRIKGKYKPQKSRRKRPTRR